MFTTFPLTTISSSGINNVAASKNGNLIYYLNDGLYSMSKTATALPIGKIIDKIFYGIDVDPKSSEIICLDDINSKAVVYNSCAVKQFDFETSAYPNSVVFSY
ncbi:MAG: hypothetical protein ACUVTX_05870 [Bacteroidales bacterium]